MIEDSDTSSSVSEVVPSPSMETLNDELNPEADKPQQELAVSRTPTADLFARFGSFLGITKSKDKVATESVEDLLVLKVWQLTKDLEESRREVDILNEKLEAINAERDRSKGESEATTSRMTEMENELKSKTREIQYLQKVEGEWKSRISQLEKEVNAANCKISDNSKVSGDVQRILEKMETNSRDLRSLLDRTNAMTIRARFIGISKLTEEGVYSQPTEFAGFSWKIYLKKNDRYLGIYLEPKKFDDVKWSCAVLAEFQLLSQKDDSIVEEWVFPKPLVNDESADWGYYNFIPFEDLLKGDAVRDDSIIVAVVARVFPTTEME